MTFDNTVGLTPLLAGAERTRLNIVEFLIKQDQVSFIDKIDALELLGASFANDKDSYSLELAYVFMRRAMELRFVFVIFDFALPQHRDIFFFFQFSIGT